jgi:thiosulfate/3-mercaptopyruvate sulfurtransferase
MLTNRKVFHCAVDDTALTTNISEIKKWAANGAITLFVPLYTLERLRGLKRAGSQIAINAREAVRFLDRVTSGRDSISSESILLQGPMEQYETWEEAEKFFLPEFEEELEESLGDVSDTSGPHQEPEKPMERTPETKDLEPSDDLSQMLLNKLNIKKEPDAMSILSTGTHSARGSRSSSRSSGTSPGCATDEPLTKTPVRPLSEHERTPQTSNSSVLTMPVPLRPLLSALLWRLHGSPDAAIPARSCILVTNDRDTQSWAQKFGIATKNIHQLRTAIQYEEKEFKNRCKYMEKTQASTEPKPLFSYENDSDEDELVFVPRGRGKGGMRAGGGRGANGRKPGVSKGCIPAPLETTAMGVPSEPIDPDSFSRSLGVTPKPPAVDLSSQAGAARGLAAASRRSGGRRGGPRGVPRGGNRGRGKLWVP